MKRQSRTKSDNTLGLIILCITYWRIQKSTSCLSLKHSKVCGMCSVGLYYCALRHSGLEYIATWKLWIRMWMWKTWKGQEQEWRIKYPEDMWIFVFLPQTYALSDSFLNDCTNYCCFRCYFCWFLFLPLSQPFRSLSRAFTLVFFLIRRLLMSMRDFERTLNTIKWTSDIV